MKDSFIKIRPYLYPISFLYGIGVRFRNLLFDWGILRSKSFNIPIICIGNLTVGGTGKTPHVEYLVRLLSKEFSIGVLSRGYKRESKGFQIIQTDSSARFAGDEPYQIKRKFPEITVAVDKKRCNGIEQLIQPSTVPELDVILLDDAFQHRYVQAGINILLIDYNRLIHQDTLLPTGSLREPKSGMKRAHIIIITKCPEHLTPMDFRVLSKDFSLQNYQYLYFSSLRYGNLQPIFSDCELKERPLNDLKDKEILLITGIASPNQLMKDLSEHSSHITAINFKDHHKFTKRDIRLIQKKFENLPENNRLLITTEKDAMRLLEHNFSEEIRKQSYYLPIEVMILQNQQENFNQNIIGYVRKNKRNSFLSERKNDN